MVNANLTDICFTLRQHSPIGHTYRMANSNFADTLYLYKDLNDKNNVTV
jgi:hypothetical protein